MDTEKGALVEKVIFALLPITFSCVVYLISALNDASQRITILESKVQVVVSADNKIIMNPASELAREKLRQDFLEANTLSKIQHESNEKNIEFLKWRIEEIEKKQK
jgi:hypothetical protein